MGLDIYFYKVKPSAGTNINSVAELSADLTRQSRENFERGIKKLLEAFERSVMKGDSVSRTAAIVDIANYVKKKNGGYDFYSDPYLDENITDIRVRELVERDIQHHFPQEDVYFRKANFVYGFFHSYLVDEQCVVTKPMVEDLIARCDEIIEAAKACGLLNANGNISSRYFYPKSYFDKSDEEREKIDERIRKAHEASPTHWVTVAKQLLPTTSGFFFGSTNYDVYYLDSVISCKKQFTKLLKNWKDGEIVYNIMSW